MPSLSLRLLLVVLLCCVLGAPMASAAGFERLSALEDQGFLIGAEARLLDSGEVLGEITPDLELSLHEIEPALQAIHLGPLLGLAL